MTNKWVGRVAATGALLVGGMLSSCTSVAPVVPVAPAIERATPDVAVAVAPAPAPMPPVASVTASIQAAAELPPVAPREFRAAWVSTVANIDWPSRANLSSVQQQSEALAILDRAKALNLNAIVLQVRPSADAIYPSTLEPWSEFLSGQQGRAPQPAYDPLAFWVAQAHARGLQLHAWFNPYRARHSAAKSPLAREHIAITHPELVKTYGKFLWMDPGEAAAAQHTQDVIVDVVRRYDIDGVHIDDYFYPYPIDARSAGGAEAAALDGAAGASRAELDFPDQNSWQRYLLSGGQLDRANWRRQNVNTLIESLYTAIHQEKNWVRFGISPFGIGRPDRRTGVIAGFSQYDKLYADAELWLEKGWLDYLAPQLYWPIAQAPQAYDVLLDYWLSQNHSARHVWPGLYTSRIDSTTRPYPAQEIVDQISVTRRRAGASGHLHFSIAALMENRKGITDLLKRGPYTDPALVPTAPWLGVQTPAAPQVSARRSTNALSLAVRGGQPGTRYAVWARYGAQWRFSVAPGDQTEINLADDVQSGAANAVFVSLVDRIGNESARIAVLRGPAILAESVR